MKNLKKLLMICFCLSLTNASAKSKSVETWASTPQETTFEKFKFMKTINKAGKASTFEHQSKPYFELTQAFNGEQTKICFGSSTNDEKTKEASGIACVLSAVGAKSCAEVDFNKCANDNSLKPVNN